ncbi:RnfH family protein [Rhodoferax sp.]|uniref:RnfH family protein n=1 Tax=Rhodoferax sp. TaxID=50421 RepID=UPI0008D75286|nr:RnfH family protein [Rhodoferax sp.]MDO8321266.1 RnfH family protein [Rhodoferax sp.]MDP2681094.1 RnfH family protein [Rhodoferax sp.]OGB76224.1 MAG: protein RnfH [Burkholderiales bacterium RIFOXYC12_FULL_60_6]OGB85000.1 MAG: protein RnfH [Burkholderiales bacterium RIFOXYD2_FULL_59_8]
MKVSVTYALPDRQSWLDVEVAEHATVRDAIEASGIFRAFPELDLSTQKVGIFGKTVALEARLETGQRVEIYRPITADPIALRGNSDDDD